MNFGDGFKGFQEQWIQYSDAHSELSDAVLGMRAMVVDGRWSSACFLWGTSASLCGVDSPDIAELLYFWHSTRGQIMGNFRAPAAVP